MSQTILYARVSTSEQTIEIQKAHATAAGFEIDEVISDVGASGISTKLAERPGGKRLNGRLRRGDVLVVRWVDRLGRNYQDVTDAIRDFMRRGIVIRTVINNMTFDGSTTDPMQEAVRDALIAFMAATAQAQVEATKEAQKAGIEAAKSIGSKYRGKKPSYSRGQLETVRDMLSKEVGASAISKMTGLSRQTVIRIRNDPGTAGAVLDKWGL